MPSLAPSQCAEITVPTNNSPFPRDPHTCSLSPTSHRLEHTCHSLSSKAPSSNICVHRQTDTHTHTLLPVILPPHSHVHNYVHKTHTFRCTHTRIFSSNHTHICKVPFGTPVPTHLYTQTHTGSGHGGWERTTSNPEAPSVRELSIHPFWRRRWQESPTLRAGFHPHTHSPWLQRGHWLPETLPRTQSPACCPQL